MSEKIRRTSRIPCVTTRKDGKNAQSEEALPFSDKTGEVQKAVFTLAFSADAPEPGGKVFFEVEGGTGKIGIFADGNEIASQSGIYSPLRLDITELSDGTEHKITVEAEKEANGNNIYLGTASFITTADSFFDTEKRGDGGVTVSTAVTDKAIDIIVKAHIANPNNYDVLRCTLVAPDGTRTVKTCKPTSPTCIFSPENVLLWNGQHESPQYSVIAEIIRDTRLLDKTEVVFGVRKACFDGGFLTLNGVKLPLNGIVLRDTAFLDDDAELFNKLDANCVKLSVFPETDAFLAECDKKGIAVWLDMTELADRDGDLLAHAVQLFAHHPSFMFASVSSTDEKTVTDFREIIHSNSDGVFTAGNASFPAEESVTDAIPDVLAVNIPSDTPLERFLELDNAFSDYINEHKLWHTAVFADPPEGFFDRHSEDFLRADCSQEFFSAWHEKFWQSFGIKKGVFGCFAGCLADEERPAGRTGLVTSDRYDKKDAFWFYKAQFSAEPFVKICSAGMTMTDKKYIDIRCYTNAPSIDMTINGKKKNVPAPEEISNCVYLFRHVKLKRRNNTIVVTAGNETDSTVIYRSKSKLKKI